jgi:hypothetical protein
VKQINGYLNVVYFTKLKNSLLKMSFEQICVVNTVALISDEMNVSYTELLEKVGIGEDALVAVVERLLRILVQELMVSKSIENLNTVWRLVWIPNFCEPDENPITGNSRYYNLCINNSLLKGIRDKANELYHIRMSEVKENTTVIATEEVKDKKKRAPAKKKEPVASEVTSSVSDVATTEAPVVEKKKRASPKKKEPVVSEATVSEAASSEVTTEPVVVEKKKRAPAKKKEPVTSEATSSEATSSEATTSEASKVTTEPVVVEKKKRAPPKKKEPVASEATVSEATVGVSEATSSEASTEPVVVEKKKRAPPKKKEPVTSEATVSEVVAVGEAVVVEKEKKKRAPKKAVEPVV